jgi:hypothetical protein
MLLSDAFSFQISNLVFLEQLITNNDKKSYFKKNYSLLLNILGA